MSTSEYPARAPRPGWGERRTSALASARALSADIWILAALVVLSLGNLRLEWRRLYRAEPPRLSRDIMTRAIAYRLQEIAHGGLSKVTRRRLTTLAESFDVDSRIAARVADLPGLRLVGNAYDGIGIPDCIRLGRRAAKELVAAQPVS